jgi:hypothetical protein
LAPFLFVVVVATYLALAGSSAGYSFVVALKIKVGKFVDVLLGQDLCEFNRK